MLQEWGDGQVAPCVHCCRPLTFETVEADRIEPGGSYARVNVQPSCRQCNLARSDKAEWVPPRVSGVGVQGFCPSHLPQPRPA